MNITTKHTEIGYTKNLDIIETALREQFGFDDCSFVLKAVAAHIWSEICGQNPGHRTWGNKEVNDAILSVQSRINKISQQLQGLP